SQDHHREIRGRTGRHNDHRGRGRRGCRNARGSVRAVPRAERISAAYAARTSRGAAGIPAFRLHATGASTANQFALISGIYTKKLRGIPRSFFLAVLPPLQFIANE